MTVWDEKAGREFEVYCPAPHRAYVSVRPKRGAHVLPKNLTKPLGYNSIEKAFRKWRDRLGPEAKSFVLHRLRKLAITGLAEAGCSDAEIQAVKGQSMEMVANYRVQVSRESCCRGRRQNGT